VGPSASDAPQSGDSYAKLKTIWAPEDPDHPEIVFQFTAGKPGGGATVEAQAFMGEGETFRVVSYPLTSQQDEVTKTLDFNPCTHPGGSDLPGTRGEFSVSVFEGESGAITAGGAEFTTLGPDTTKPAITINSQPPPGRVEPGNEILIDATAQENRNGPSWQRGVKSFQLTATPGGQVGEPQQARSPLPLPCDRKQWSLATQGTYLVPANAPVIEICAIAEDFAGNIQTKCNKYYTGKVWKGKARVTSSVVYPGPASPTYRDGWELEFTFVVGSDGTIEGQGTAELTSAPTCSPIGWCPPPAMVASSSLTHIEYQVLGEETEAGFSLRFGRVRFDESIHKATVAGFASMFGAGWRSPSGGTPVFVAVSGTSGTGQGMWQFRSGNPPATYSANGKITLECVTCEEPVG
jgi:hypothetical protein